ncbi:MAG: DUF1641 domain-containing protein [Nannocystaceae bacterium]
MQPPQATPRLPSTADTLARIEAKLDRLERVLGPLEALAEAPAVAATAMETVDSLAQGQEPELDGRLRGAVALLERISRPQTLAMLERAVELAESLPDLLSTATDTIDGMVDPEGTDLHGRIEAGMRLLARASHPDTLHLITELLAQITDPEPVQTGIPLLDAHAKDGMGMEQLTRQGLQLVGQTVVFLRHAQASGERRLGLFGLLKAMRDPSTQRAVGFAMSVLEGFGQALDGTGLPKQLRA